MEETIATTEPQPFRGEDWFDPLEGAVRERIRGFIEEMLEAELDAALQRRRYGRRSPAHGHRHGHRERHLIGTFGPVTVSVPRARLAGVDGRTSEWRNRTIPSYKRLTKRAEALIAATYLAGTNTRRVRRALAALFGGAIGKDIVSRAWHKVQTDWEAWQERDLSKDDIVRLILDGTVVRVRLDKRATGLSLLVALGVRRDGQKVLLGLKDMGGESEASWRVFPGRVGRPWSRHAGDRHRRWRTGPGGGACGAVADGAGSALHRSQAPQPVGPCAEEAARRDQRRLHGHDLCENRQGRGGQAQDLRAEMAAEMPRHRR